MFVIKIVIATEDTLNDKTDLYCIRSEYSGFGQPEFELAQKYENMNDQILYLNPVVIFLCFDQALDNFPKCLEYAFTYAYSDNTGELIVSADIIPLDETCKLTDKQLELVAEERRKFFIKKIPMQLQSDFGLDWYTVSKRLIND